MICPRCQEPMRTVDRRGVHIEQCQGCRGIFLDRGELEQIASAERSFYGSAPAPYQEQPYPQQPQPQQPQPAYGYRDSPPPYQGYRDSPPPYGSRRGHRRRGFLEELFD